MSSELGYPTNQELAQEIARELGLENEVKKISSELTLSSLAETYNEKRREIIREIRLILSKCEENAGNKRLTASNPYFLLAMIIRALIRSGDEESRFYILTTNFDRELELAMGALSFMPWDYVIYRSKDDLSREHKVEVYKVHGDYMEEKNGRDTLILTNNDEELYKKDREALYENVRAFLERGMPLIVIGHGWTDKDIVRLYREAKNRGKAGPAYFINIVTQEERELEDFTPLRMSAGDFMRELADELRSLGYDIPDFDLGIMVSFDKDLKDALSRSSQVFLTGHSSTGKTLAVLRIFAEEGKAIEGYRHIELPKSSMDSRKWFELRDYINKTKERLIIEGTEYQLHYLFNPGSMNESKEDWVKRIKGFFMQNKEPRLSIPREGVLVKAHLTREDAERIFNYYIEREHVTVENQGLNEKFISIASWEGDEWVFFPSLLKRLIRKHLKSDSIDVTNEEYKLRELELVEERHRKVEEILIGEFGVATTVKLIELVPGVLDLLAPLPLALAGSVIMGMIGVIYFYHHDRESTFDKIIKLLSHWRELPEEKRRFICEKLDEKFLLPPGSSYDFLLGEPE